MKLKNTFLIIISLVISILGCEEENSGTMGELPIITTNSITNITSTTAICGGVITDDGGLPVIDRGVCWSKSQDPTISDEHTINGKGTGYFASSLEELDVNTTYYVRAYATNSIGIVYGNEQNFRSDRPVITGQTGILNDIDGNVYNWIGIGKQAWMTRNLNTTHYANGKEITLVESTTSWDALEYSDIAMSYYNNSSDDAYIYGALYTWTTAMNNDTSSSVNPSNVQGACPDGWHLPSNAEWAELVNFLTNNGYSDNEAAALKSTSGWADNGNGTDNFGFTALPTGQRQEDGGFEFLGYTTYFWSTESNESSFASVFGLAWYSNTIYSNNIYNPDKNSGSSVRCVKNY